MYSAVVLGFCYFHCSTADADAGVAGTSGAFLFFLIDWRNRQRCNFINEMTSDIIFMTILKIISVSDLASQSTTAASQFQIDCFPLIQD
jgi:hypothetical protein